MFSAWADRSCARANGARQLGTARVLLVNDLIICARGLATLRDDELEVIQAGSPASHGNQAVIAAGTGLGEGLLIRQGEQLIVGVEPDTTRFAHRGVPISPSGITAPSLPTRGGS